MLDFIVIFVTSQLFNRGLASKIIIPEHKAPTYVLFFALGIHSVMVCQA